MLSSTDQTMGELPWFPKICETFQSHGQTIFALDRRNGWETAEINIDWVLSILLVFGWNMSCRYFNLKSRTFYLISLTLCWVVWLSFHIPVLFFALDSFTSSCFIWCKLTNIKSFSPFILSLLVAIFCHIAITSYSTGLNVFECQTMVFSWSV